MPEGLPQDGVVTYQFTVDEEEWRAWKNTVPRSKSLDTRIRELLQADREGRVLDEGEAPPAPTAAASAEPPAEEPPAAAEERDDQDASAPATGEAGATEAIPEAVASAVREVAQGWDDSEERLAKRRWAAERVLAYAIRTGEAVGKSTDAVRERHDERPVEGQSYETWWRKNVRPVLKEYGTYSRAAKCYRVEEGDLP